MQQAQHPHHFLVQGHVGVVHHEGILCLPEGRNLPVPHCLRDSDGWQIRRELQWGVYGKAAREACLTLSKEQQLAVADELLNVIQMGSCLSSFCRIMRQLFPGCFVYQVKKHPQILYVYLDKAREVSTEKRWHLARDTFLPLDIEARVFWDVHFGILGVDFTMQADKIAIF